jgi:peptidoglycan/LPS O-acetylase OafA/YrhL
MDEAAQDAPTLTWMMRQQLGGNRRDRMNSTLRFVGLAILVIVTVYAFLNSVIIAAFRGDQIVAVYALQLGSIVLFGLLIGAIVAHFRHRSMRLWMLCFSALAAAIMVVTVVSWHIVDDRECPAYPTTPDGCFNPQLR